MAQSIYVRLKNPAGKWRYVHVKTGRGRQIGDYKPPFYVRPTRDGKQTWHALGAETFRDAAAEAEKIHTGLEAQSKGLTVTELEDSNRISIKKAVEKFLAQATATKKRKTVLGYRLNLTNFLESTKAKFLDEVDGDTVREFRDFLTSKGFDVRTVHNRIITVLSLLKKNKIKTDFAIKDDLAKFEDEICTAYGEEYLQKLFAAMDPEEEIRYKFFLGSGCRDKEVTFAAWDDINFEEKTYHVRPKRDVGFSPKNHEDRVIPLPTVLVEALKRRKAHAPHPRWIFVNEEGRPDNHFLRKLKRIAFHAGLNCGQCKTTVTKGRYDTKYKAHVTCKTDPVCEQFFLHRFRKTCATRWHEENVPLRTIQRWLGHKSLETTQIYLAETGSTKLRPNIDRAFERNLK